MVPFPYCRVFKKRAFRLPPSVLLLRRSQAPCKLPRTSESPGRFFVYSVPIPTHRTSGSFSVTFSLALLRGYPVSDPGLFPYPQAVSPPFFYPVEYRFLLGILEHPAVISVYKTLHRTWKIRGNPPGNRPPGISTTLAVIIP